MQEKNNINKEFLDYSKKNSFLVPEGYFENFSNRINERIRNEQNSPVQKKAFSLKTFSNSKLAMAASLLIFISISYFTINIILNQDKQETISKYYADIIEYEISEFDLGLLAEFYYEDELSKLDENYSEEDTEIIDYLISENIDIELIIEEL